MINIKIYELDKHRNETTFRPILQNKDLFNEIGINFVTNGKSDFAFVGQASLYNKKLLLEDSMKYGLNFLSNVKEPYFIFDGQDAATIIGIYEIIVKSNPILVFKNTLYKDRKEYLKKSVNGRIYWGHGDYSLPDLNIFNKIKLSHMNWLSTVKPEWYDYNENKNYDVCALFGFGDKINLEHGVDQFEPYNNFRKRLFDNLGSKFKTYKLENNKRLEPNEYYNKMYNSKIILAPFGFGEIAPRDIESAMFGSVLIKPDMSHIETLPDIYIPYETYVPCKHDFSDLNEKIDYVLSDYKNIQTKYVENFRKRYIEVFDSKKMILYYYEIFKNLNQYFSIQ